MVHTAGLLHIVGRFLLLLAACMLVPLFFSLSAGEDPAPFIFAMACTVLAGGFLAFPAGRRNAEPSRRDGILLVFAAWMAAGVFGCLPYCLSPHFPGFTDAFFESTSGFTTTGATILADVEILPRSLQLWRCFSSWLGGMGAVLLGVAVLPLVGTGGMPLYRAEFPGARSEKLTRRIYETARSLWKIYFGLTVADYLALRWAGMGRFDAVCHSFTTVSTGGFSTRNAGIAAFDSPAVEGVLILFMLLAGVNFTLHYRLWAERRVRRFISDVELRFYLLVAAAAAAVILVCLMARDGYGFASALRHSIFQACSVMTGTGLATDDYGNWSSLPQLILLALMFVGGCTCSTTGGLKASRMLMLAKVIGREFRRMVEGRGVFTIRMGSRSIPEETVQSLLNLCYLVFLANFIFCLLLSLSGIDIISGISAVAACMFNAGPGLGQVGPALNYGSLPALAKWLLSLCMVAGRLEFYAVLVLFTRAFWRS
ncbi:MAG: TrkH family potassium uptake protein [Acidobacteria bacterium]|nr:TrkH family potassium uptake protein [Acidobacteriota bacterium]